MSVASSVDYLKTLKKTIDAIYQSIGRRTILKYADFAAWYVNKVFGAPIGNESSISVDGTKAIFRHKGNGGSCLASRAYLPKKIDLTSITTLTFDVACGTPTPGYGGNPSKFGVSTVITSGVFSGTSITLPVTSARSTKTIDVTALTGMHYLVLFDGPYYASGGDNGGLEVYGVKANGVDVYTPHKADNSNGELKLSTSNTMTVWSPLITGSFQWDTLQGSWNKTYGTIVVNILDENLNTLLADVKDLAVLSSLAVEKIYIEFVLTGTPAQSPIAKDIWISYLS